MPFIRTTPAEEATGATLAMYQRQETAWGFVPSYAKVFCHRPEVMARWGRLLAEIRRPAGDRRFELVTLAVALELRHSACSLAHGKNLAKLIGDNDVRMIADGGTPGSLTDAEVAMMHFARRIGRDAARITSGEVDALKNVHGFTDAEVFDIAAIAAARCFFAKVLDALGAEPDIACMNIDPPLRRSLTVGRPISRSKPEHTRHEGAAVD